MGKGKNRIVITEIPYQVNKARVIENIADLSRNKIIDGITALRDESDRKGMVQDCQPYGRRGPVTSTRKT